VTFLTENFRRVAVTEKENFYHKMASSLDEQLQFQRERNEELEVERGGLIKLIKEMNDEVIAEIRTQIAFLA
jgi:hypothetical protein